MQIKRAVRYCFNRKIVVVYIYTDALVQHILSQRVLPQESEICQRVGNTMTKILIVEDDDIISSQVKKHIESWGCECRCVKNFERVLEEFRDFSPHLVLLDIYLPFFNGYHWCAEIRKISKVPIIFISSASDNMNIVMAMNMGADDFITKPFDLNVLTAKVQAMLRRTYDFAVEEISLEYNGFVLNKSNASASYKGHTIELTKNEYRILLVLMQNKGKTVSRDSLMLKLWATDSFVDENTLTVNVTRLRKKLESYGLNGFIKTKKGMGYIVG